MNTPGRMCRTRSSRYTDNCYCPKNTGKVANWSIKWSAIIADPETWPHRHRGTDSMFGMPVDDSPRQIIPGILYYSRSWQWSLIIGPGLNKKLRASLAAFS
eukprot:scaffold75905_cov30-Prasinocladus_malaysianus.AAC.1